MIILLPIYTGKKPLSRLSGKETSTLWRMQISNLRQFQLNHLFDLLTYGSFHSSISRRSGHSGIISVGCINCIICSKHQIVEAPWVDIETFAYTRWIIIFYNLPRFPFTNPLDVPNKNKKRTGNLSISVNSIRFHKGK